MAKYYKIRWTDEDTEELSKAVKNFNAKISRIAKRKPSIKNFLPDKVSVKKLKNLINTRNDLKREINALKRFSRKGAETIIKAPNTSTNAYVTKWQKEELIRRVAIVNRKRRERKEYLYQLPAKSRGEDLGYTLGQALEFVGMGKVQEVELLPIKAFTMSMTPTEIRKKHLSTIIQTQSDYFTKKDYQLRENYLKGILTHYNEEDVADVIEKIKSIDIKEFLDTFYEEGADTDIASPDFEEILKRFEYEGYVESLKSTWL